MLIKERAELERVALPVKGTPTGSAWDASQKKAPRVVRSTRGVIWGGQGLFAVS